MPRTVTSEMLDPKTPPDVVIRAEARRPETDPTLGIAVALEASGTPSHRLVAIGDSLTQGFQSGAIFNTALSYPALIAQALGQAQFRFPTYGGPGDGLPLNLEKLARLLEARFGDTLDWWEFAPGLLAVREFLDQVEDYWERGEGSISPPETGPINHNLAIYGWDLRNTLSYTADLAQDMIDAHPPTDNLINQIVEHANQRATLRVLNSARDQRRAFTPLQAAAALGAAGTQETGTGDGIETLIVMIGANNVLGSILTFNVAWSAEGYDDLARNDRYTVWRPIHFQAEWDRLVVELKKIRARHVVIGTVPHVTIAPLARGVGQHKAQSGSRYFPYYTFPWFDNNSFNPQKNPHITEQEARAIDSAIDQYNDYIAASVRQAREEGRDWYLFELCGLLDRVASRRYLDDPAARPSWWEAVGGQYELPAPLQSLSPVPDSRFFQSNKTGRQQGGIFSLDGIHPTTIGYGVMAQEIIKIMQQAGVKFYDADGRERQGSVQIDFARLIQQDTLISNPPSTLSSSLSLIGWLDRNFNIFGQLLRSSL